MDARGNPSVHSRNQRLLLTLLGVVVGMIGLSFASVPLYQLFCQVTGFGGTTQVAGDLEGMVASEHRITVRFNADVNGGLPWRFRPEVREIDVRLGEGRLIAYRARNQAARHTTGTAIYNVTPLKAGLYFNKVQCFCFDEQGLVPGQEADFPVYFFVDPAMAEDPDLAHVDTITLSYTFYPAASAALEEAVEALPVPAESASAVRPAAVAQTKESRNNG